MKYVYLFLLLIIFCACKKEKTQDAIDVIVGTYKGWEYQQGIRYGSPYADSLYTEIKIEKIDKDKFIMKYWGFDIDGDTVMFNFKLDNSQYALKRFREVRFNFTSDGKQINLTSDVTVTKTDYDGNTSIEYQSNTQYKGEKDL